MTQARNPGHCCKRRSSALAELAAALPQATDAVAAGRLALAALLRPALFDPDHGARGILKNLVGLPGLEAQAPLIEALAARNAPPSEEEVSGAEDFFEGPERSTP